MSSAAFRFLILIYSMDYSSDIDANFSFCAGVFQPGSYHCPPSAVCAAPPRPQGRAASEATANLLLCLQPFRQRCTRAAAGRFC